jgi:uncharacterized protein YbjQ (UPF0145 family)
MEQAYPATQSVEVLRTKPVDRAYIELGELSVRVKKSTEESAILFLKEKAREIGADAIVVLGERSEGAVAVPSGYNVVVVPLRGLVAVAIKYKQENIQR